MNCAEKFPFLVLTLLTFALSSVSRAQQSVLDAFGTNAQAATPPPAAPPPVAPAPSSAPAPNLDLSSPVAPPPTDPVLNMLRDAFQLMSHGNQEAALEKVNDALKLAPQNADAYGLRGSIYSEQKQWDQATKDFQMVLQIDANNVPAKFNLAEIKFRQKEYDDARPGFEALEKDSDLGDLATYKVFLCDLFSGHEDVASKELDVFNQVGSNASYYFGNAAWSLYHKKIEDGRTWLISAVQIFSPNKVNLYASSLKDLGYLPLPPPPPKA